MTNNIIRLTPPLRVVQQSNAYGFDPVEEIRDRIEVTAGLRKIYAVRVDGVIWPGAEYDVATLAIRCAEHLRGLDRLGCLHAPQPESVRDMLKASVEEIVK